MNYIISSIKSLSAIILDSYPNATDGAYPEAIKRLQELVENLDEKSKVHYDVSEEDASIIADFLSDLEEIRKDYDDGDDSIDWLYEMIQSIHERVKEKRC